MKQSFFKALLMMVAILAFTQIYAHKPTIGEGNAAKHSILLNGQPIDIQSFTLSSKGTLTIVEDNPNQEKAKKVPFKIYLKRNGEMFFVGQFLVKKDVYEAEISEVLAYAFGGDELILELSGKSENKGKRTIRLKSLEFWRINKDGC
jgi:hypothetical protein